VAYHCKSRLGFIQTRRRDIAPGGAKNQKGVPHFKNTVLDVCSNQEAKREMGVTDFKWGGRAPLPPPLGTTLVSYRSIATL